MRETTPVCRPEDGRPSVPSQDHGGSHSSSRVVAVRCGRLGLLSAPKDFIFSGEPERFKHVVTVNAEIFVLAHENPHMKRILEQTTNTIDGQVLAWLCQSLYRKTSIRRFVGADMIYDLAEFCHTSSERIFVLGSTPDALGKGIGYFLNHYPGLQITGYSPPISPYPFAAECNDEILARIAEFRPHHLLVCFGPVKQERWINDNGAQLAELGVRRAYGLGGTIDFVASKQKRAPRWIQNIGLEWLFRFAYQPRARFRRTLTMFRMPYYVAKTEPEILTAKS